jgi:predicted HTH transcriptional regulator
MFYPHYSEIEITRAEPENVDGELEDIVKERISFIAERVVTSSFLKGKKIKKQTQNKIRKLEERDARKKSLESFMERWNYWRRFYFDIGPNTLKTTSQMGAVENIIKMAKENNLNLDMLIASVHKGYAWGKLRPTFTTVLSKGVDLYDQYYEDVLADIDNRSYEDEAIE